MISFEEIPLLRTPLVAVEFNSSFASQGPSILAYKALIIAQKTSAGTGTANVPTLISSSDDARVLGGVGSQAHEMAKAFLDGVAAPPETWLLLLDDAGAAVVADGEFAITGTATSNGEIAFYVGGHRIPISVTTGDTATVIGAALVAAIDDNTALPIENPVNTTGTVTFDAKNAGTSGNRIPLTHSYQTGEKLPAGISVAVTDMANGVTPPTITTAISNMGDEWYNVVVHPFVGDNTQFAALKTEMVSRAGALRSLDGMLIGGANGTLSELVSLGSAENNQFSMIIGPDGDNAIETPYVRAARAAAEIAVAAQIDPARPFQTLVLDDLYPSRVEDRFTLIERNTLLFNGIATTKAGPGGVVQLDRMITTYQQNAAGAADTAYLDATTVFTLMYLRYSFIARIKTRYPRHKLADDGAPVGPGQPVMTPSVGKAEALSWFLDMIELGLVEGYEAFKAALVVERDVSDPNRMNWFLPPDLMNQFIVGAGVMAFKL